MQELLDKALEKNKIFGTSFAMKKNGKTYLGTSGNFAPSEQFFIASTTKLFVTTLVLQLKDEGKLQLNDKINVHLSDEHCTGIHRYKGKDYSDEITIENLLAHTTGLPDYFQDKDDSGTSLEQRITSGQDTYWHFNDVIAFAKKNNALFAPGTKNKAHYSDINFQLLGKIIENITGLGLEENLNQRIFTPLKLSKTYLYNSVSDNRPKPLNYKEKPLLIPKAMTSFWADGGIVSTAEELLVFTEAFFTNQLFTTKIDALKKWNKIFFPMQAGIGIHRFKLPWFFDPFGAVPEMIGHSGLSGTIAYACPEKNLFIAGTVNQVAYPDRSFRLMIKLLRKVK